MSETCYLRLSEFQSLVVAGDTVQWKKEQGTLVFDDNSKRLLLPFGKDYKIIVKIGTRFSSVNGFMSLKVFDHTAETAIGSQGDLFASDQDNIENHATLNNKKFETKIRLSDETTNHEISVIIVDQLNSVGILADLSYLYVEEF